MKNQKIRYIFHQGSERSVNTIEYQRTHSRSAGTTFLLPTGLTCKLFTYAPFLPTAPCVGRAQTSNYNKNMEITDTILTREQIQDRVAVLGNQISTDYVGRELVLIGILNGAFIFLADLARAIDLELEVDFIRVASYGDTTSTSGTITLSKKPELELQEKDILLVEDIVDTGTTITWLHDYFAQYEPASVKTCTLIDKHERRKTEVNIDYAGFTLNKGFLIGYGLDFAQKFRNLPAVHSMQE